MKSTSFVLALAAIAGRCAAVGVTGSAPGFATGTTGGGSAIGAYPKDITELKLWLTDSTPRVILINKEYNFIGSEGTVTETGCRPTSNSCPGNGGQDAINLNGWCVPQYAGAGVKPISVTYDKAGIVAINMGSNKSIVGVGANAVIRGKGLRIANAKNIIIQNIHITELNPQYIWGGDAITLAGTDLIWIDHVKISLIGRQHFVTGGAASNRVALTNNEFDGVTSWSATCDNHHYYAIFFTGANDLVTFAGNYIHHTSGRSPKMTAGTLLHAVNNYWYQNSGHAFDIHAGVSVVAEGNTFSHVTTPLLENLGSLFAPSATSSVCKNYLGHDCERNSLGASGSFTGTDTSMLTLFTGKNVIAATAPRTNQAITAGVGKI